ncbi:hypothetical protein KBC03_08235 [Patescibacteria group bacterium]|nr:hypothetical protein [Patescibacteria group bacterium]
MEITNPIVKKILEKYEIVWAINYLLKLSRRDMETYMPEGASFMRGQVHGQLDMHVQQLLLDKEFTMLVASLA